MGLFGRKKSTIATRHAPAKARVELNVSPSWWTLIHHRRHGAFGLALHELTKALDRHRIDPIEVHATEDRLTVVLALESDNQEDYERAASDLRTWLEREITIEERDLLDPAPEPTTKETEPEAEAPPAKPVTRAAVEVTLRECGFVPSSELDLADRKPDDADIWSLPDTASRCVQFDEATKPDEDGKARWMTPAGEQVLSFAHILVRLQAFRSSAKTEDPTPEGHQGILPGDGQAHGGVFGKAGDHDG